MEGVVLQKIGSGFQTKPTPLHAYPNTAKALPREQRRLISSELSNGILKAVWLFPLSCLAANSIVI